MKIQIIKYDNVDSTNNVAIRRIKKGKIKPTLIIANSQKKGKGNMEENGFRIRVIYLCLFIFI